MQQCQPSRGDARHEQTTTCRFESSNVLGAGGWTRPPDMFPVFKLTFPNPDSIFQIYSRDFNKHIQSMLLFLGSKLISMIFR
jgi:hypothetical protein